MRAMARALGWVAVLLGVVAGAGCKRLVEGECGAYESRARGPLRETRDVLLEVSRKLPAAAPESGAEVAGDLSRRVAAQLALLDKIELRAGELGQAGADLHEKLAAIESALSEVLGGLRGGREGPLQRAGGGPRAQGARAAQRLVHRLCPVRPPLRSHLFARDHRPRFGITFGAPKSPVI